MNRHPALPYGCLNAGLDDLSRFAAAHLHEGDTATLHY